MPITKDIIREIKSRVDIVSEVGNYVHSLRRTGKNWVGLCPFHNDKNPSFTVSSEHGSYICFACGEKGDVFSFIQKIENCTFSEAVVMLGRKVGINVEYDNNSAEYAKKDKILGFNERVVKLFQYFLLNKPEAEEARRYAASRQLTADIIEKFKLGYAPRGYGRLENIFEKKGFSPEFLVTTGLFKNGDRGIRSMFFDRLMFPIINYKNEVVGFGGRTLDPNGKPKYINTPETDVYKKHDNLYGINVSKEFIQKERRVYMVEGYMDVIACYKSGLRNVVAPCGTAVTDGQIRLLTRYADEIVFLLDGDAAGMKGAARGLFQTANIEKIRCSVLVLPNDMDPDDYFKENTIDDFREFEKQRTDAIDFLVFFYTQSADVHNLNELMTVLDNLFSFVVKWDNQIIRDQLVDRIAMQLGINETTVKSEFEKYAKSHIQTDYNALDNHYEESHSKQNEPLADNNISAGNVPSNNIVRRDRALTDRDKIEIEFVIYLTNCAEYKEIVRKCSFDETFLMTDIGKALYRLIFDNELEQAKKMLADVTDNSIAKNYINETIFRVSGLIIQEARDDNLKNANADITDTSVEVNTKMVTDNVYDRIYEIKKYYYINKSREITEKIKFGDIYKDEALVKELQEEKILIQGELDNLAVIKRLKGGAKK